MTGANHWVRYWSIADLQGWNHSHGVSNSRNDAPGWYYQLSAWGDPRGPFHTENEAEEALKSFTSRK